ncbi:prenylated rab acceptor PRA1 [Crucibulum laeve]|uniref:PRA1 family protein n=1 Tax=Crucibulum laeve TaxID=68775 RepID=A0A5C3MG74_9AGAR|nr:prenylated rab acceptor PRA1 [Crucibulum laeve]
MDLILKATDVLKSLKETRLSGLRSPSEFFDYQRISRPADSNAAFSRISYNTRYFSGNYGLVVAALGVYALLTNWLLLVSLAFLVGGFIAINRFAPDATQFGEHTITQKHLYTGLLVIGIPLFWWAGPFFTFFWLIGASSILILGHACMLEPGVESDYATIQENV